MNGYVGLRPLRRAMGLVLAAAVAVGMLVVVPISAAEPAAASTGSDFDPGYIVSDDNFYDGSSLDGNVVQNFLLSRNSRCAAGHACLWNFRQNTPNMSADRYCQAMAGAASESAASIIARVGWSCGISQRTLLVLLEKEQGLVSAASPTQRAFDHATGFSCPDTAPCNPAFSGFFYQVYYAARQFQVYRGNPGSFGYKARAWNNILYHTDRACGSSSVYVVNDATASLYIYTPYRPNAAALGNLYGSGDRCSSYGNRNFWRLWSDWFGSPTGPPLTLGRVAGTQSTYLLGAGQRYLFPSAEMLAQYSGFGAVREISQAQLNSYVQAGPVQRAVRSTDGGTYLIEPNWRFRFTSCSQVADFGMSCDSLPTVAASQLARVADVGYLRNLVLLPNRSTWLMQGGQRRETPDPRVLAPYGISSQASGLSNFSIGSNQIGSPVVGTGLFTDDRGSFRTVNPSGTYDLKAGAVGDALGQRAQSLEGFSYERLSANAVMPPRIVSDNRGFLLSDGGWLEVATAMYGGASRFTALPSKAWAGIPLAHTQLAPHFVRERSSGQRYLASGGYLQPVTPAEQDSVSRSYGVENRLWITADAALGGIDRLFSQPYSLVRLSGTQSVYLVSGAQRHAIPTPEMLALYSPLGAVQELSKAQLDNYTEATTAQRAIRASDGNVYLIDQGKRYRFSSCAQALDFAFACDQLPLVTLTQLAKLPDAGPVRSLVKLPDGSTWFLQGGKRRETPDPAVLASYGVPPTTTALSNAVLAPIPVGQPVLGAGVVTDGQGHYLAVGGNGNFAPSAAAVAGQLGVAARRLQAASFAQLPSAGSLPLRATADGRSFLATDTGWLEVSSAAYGGASSFTAVPTRAWTGVPVVRTQLAPHFVRERAANQVFLVSGGYLSPVANQSAQAWITTTYGVENRVWVAADGALQGVPRPPY